MGITDAKRFVGKTCSVEWVDRSGHPVHTVSRIHDVTYVPLYGGYLVADTEDIRLDKILAIAIYGEESTRQTYNVAEEVRLPMAA